MNNERIARQLVDLAKRIVTPAVQTATDWTTELDFNPLHKKIKVGKWRFEFDGHYQGGDVYRNIGKYEGLLSIKLGILPDDSKIAEVGVAGFSKAFNDWEDDIAKKAGYEDITRNKFTNFFEEDDKARDKVIDKALNSLVKEFIKDAKKIWKGWKVKRSFK